MAAKKQNKSDKPQRARGAADAIVMLAMAVVTVALGIGLYQQFQITFWLSVIAALAVYIGLLAVHALVRRSDRLAALAAEVARLEAEVARLGGGRPVETDLVKATAPTRAQIVARATGVAPPASTVERRLDDIPPAARGTTSAAVPSASHAPAAAPAAQRPPPLPNGMIAEDGGSLKDLWSFRPADVQAGIAAGAWPDPERPAATAARREPVLPPLAPQRAAASPAAEVPPALPARAAAESWHAAEPKTASAPMSGGEPQLDARPAPTVASPREADVEMIQGLIKKLADQVNAAEAAAAQPSASDTRAVDTAIRNSLMALRTTADTMRAPNDAPRQPVRGEAVLPPSVPNAAAPPPPVAPPVAANLGTLPPPIAAALHESPTRVAAAAIAHATLPASVMVETPPPPPAAMAPPAPAPAPASHRDDQLAAISDALSGGRIEVLLDPILGLTDQRARHYEVSLRLRDRAGRAIETPDDGQGLGGTGLLPLLDCARLNRSSQVARRLAEKGRAGSLFTGMTGEALAHDQFLSDFAEAYAERNDLAQQLVLTLPQADVNVFGARDWDTLNEMRELGFRFALGAVTDLDMDFEALKQQGFDFVKLDANVFLDGMPAAGGVVPSSDICRHLSGLGMTLIVGEIADEAQLARIFGFGVLFGQGQLFGGPRPMKIGAAKPSGHLAA